MKISLERVNGRVSDLPRPLQDRGEALCGGEGLGLLDRSRDADEAGKGGLSGFRDLLARIGTGTNKSRHYPLWRNLRLIITGILPSAVFQYSADSNSNLNDFDLSSHAPCLT